MAICLYDPDAGFFSTGPVRSSADGDFLTSPEVSPWFGRTIARHVAAEQRRLGQSGFTLVEVGAGSGSLLAPLLEALDVTPQVWAVEASAPARDRLVGVAGAGRVVGSLHQLPTSLHGVVVANELLDNLPVAIAVRAGDTWEERWVGVDGGELTLQGTPARPAVAAWADRFGSGTPEGGVVEVQIAAGEWLRAMLARLEGGTLLLFDYGGTVDELASRRAQGTLRTYRRHHLGPDPLLAPGETDITVDVNFTAVGAAVADAGWSVEILRQDDYLDRWGLGDVIADLRSRELEAARTGDPMERLRLRAERTDAETLVHPRGLGDFRVLLATA